MSIALIKLCPRDPSDISMLSLIESELFVDQPVRFPDQNATRLLLGWKTVHLLIW
jgi:hypothetical protein